MRARSPRQRRQWPPPTRCSSAPPREGCCGSRVTTWSDFPNTAAPAGTTAERPPAATVHAAASARSRSTPRPAPAAAPARPGRAGPDPRIAAERRRGQRPSADPTPAHFGRRRHRLSPTRAPGGAVSDVAPLRRVAVRVRAASGHRACRRRQSRRGVPDRLRPPRHDARPGPADDLVDGVVPAGRSDQSHIHRRLAALHPGPRVRHQPGPGAFAEGQAILGSRPRRRATPAGTACDCRARRSSILTVPVNAPVRTR